MLVNFIWASPTQLNLCDSELAGLVHTEFAGKITDSLNDGEAVRVITLVIIDAQKEEMSLL